jgi:hypothetical protein
MTEKPKRDFAPANRDTTAALVLIGLGVLFLLGNFDIIGGLARLWPLLLVGIGVWMLYGRGKTMDIKHERYTTPVNGAQSARVRLGLPIGENTIGAASDPALLIDADMHFVGEMRFAAEGTAEKLVSLAQTGDSWTEWINPSNWNVDNRNELRSTIGLNTVVPTDLDIHGSIGKSEIDLSGMTLSGLNVNGGVGEILLKLPPGDLSTVSIQVGIGRVEVTVPSGAALQARIRGGVGETVVNVPSDAAMRVEVHSGIGGVTLPARFQRVSGSSSGFDIGKNGVWETPGYADAPRQIVLDFDGGVGQLIVR